LFLDCRAPDFPKPAIGGLILFFLVFRIDSLEMSPGGERSGEKAEEGKRG